MQVEPLVMASPILHYLTRAMPLAEDLRESGTPDPRGGWPTVMMENRRWLAAAVYARLLDRDAVDDVLQNTALAAMRTGLPEMGRMDLDRWLYKVAIRQALLYRRRNARHSLRLVRMAELRGDGSSPAMPWERSISAEQGGFVRQALAHLPPHDRQVLLWKYCEGWSCQLMAQRIGVSVTAVKSRLLRARQRMREILLELEPNWEQP